MQIKEYTLAKMPATMVNKNEDIYYTHYDNKALVDLSLLRELHLDDCDFEAIVANIQEYHVYHDRYPVFIVLVSPFRAINVRAKFVNHNVFNAKTWRKRYTISELVKVEVSIGSRTALWQNYTTETVTASSGHGEPLEDVLI